MDGVIASLAPAVAPRPAAGRYASADEEELMRAIAARGPQGACLILLEIIRSGLYHLISSHVI